MSHKPLLLIVDDDPLIVDTLTLALADHFEIVSSHSRPSGLQLLRQLRKMPELVLVDLGLPPTPHRPNEGFALIQEILSVSSCSRILVLTGQNEEENARHARALGAHAFIAKPCKIETLKGALIDALTTQALIEAAHRTSAHELIGHSPAIHKLRLQLRQYANSPFPVLIEGESGCGKEIVASSCLQLDTPRAHKPFFALNCAAIAPTLVEPTLFGYAKGAFTGAQSARAGYFEETGDGTLFLDEIGELPLELQSKLLRVLENGEYQRVGETLKRTCHARIIAATNRDLRHEVKQGRFRADLYHRLSVFTVHVPPLREMGEDKFLLLDHFRRLISQQTKQRAFTLDEEAQSLWGHYTFPGNVRELRNIVIRLTALYSGEIVSKSALMEEFDFAASEESDTAAHPTFSLDDSAIPESSDQRLLAIIESLKNQEQFSLDKFLSSTEQLYIEAALQLSHGNISQAAKRLGINRTTLYSRMDNTRRGSDVP